jgi:hypothetical protein
MKPILGHQIGQQLCDALGLPKNTVGFTLRCHANEMVSVAASTGRKTSAPGCETAPSARTASSWSARRGYLGVTVAKRQPKTSRATWARHWTDGGAP